MIFGKGVVTSLSISRFWSSIKGKGSVTILKNEAIKVPLLLYINERNEKVGPLPSSEVLALLPRSTHDLVLVNPTLQPHPLAKAVPRPSPSTEGNMKSSAAAAVANQTIQRLKCREKEVRFTISMAEHDRRIRWERMREFLGKAYRVKMVVEGVRRGGAGMAVRRDQAVRDLVGRLEDEYGKDLVWMGKPESFGGDVSIKMYLASANPPSTKPIHKLRPPKE